jgi:hypothetical protein
MLLALVLARCAGGPPADATPPSIEIVKPLSDAAFDRTFAWRPFEKAAGYRVVVFNDAGERSFELRDLRGTSVALAASVVLPPGRYFWQVIALANGVELAQSARTPFTIR